MQKKKLIEILNVLPVFQDLMNMKSSNFKLLHSLAKAAKELEEHRSFYVNQERKLAFEYASKDKDGNLKVAPGTQNQILFPDKESTEKFNEEILKLQQTEVEIFDTIVIDESDFVKGGFTMTPRQVLFLEGFVEIKYDGKDDKINKEA